MSSTQRIGLSLLLVLTTILSYGVFVQVQTVRVWLFGPSYRLLAHDGEPCMTVYFDDTCHVREANGCCINKSGIDSIALVAFATLVITSLSLLGQCVETVFGVKIF